MDIKWIKTFVIAAEYENFRKASEVLFIAQPTITVHIKHLEEALGQSLFEKSGRNVVLTQAGKRFFPHAKRILDQYHTGIHDMESWRQGYTNKMVVAVSPLIAASILPSIIRQFVKKNREIEIVIKVMESADIGEEVYSGEAHVGLTRMEPLRQELTIMELYKDPVILVTSHDGMDSENGPPIDVEELIQEQIILTHNHPVYWDDLLYEIGQKYHRYRTMVVSQVHVTKRFIEEGLGISFLPRSTVRRELMEGRMLEVLTPDFKLPVASTYIVTKEESKEVLKFKQFLRQFYTL
ncbi:LysR family transcriptional regulator [Bacillus sp. 31A1R]|uniref:LysR family transcriptional regulator n=1 Tax=Robertmurraya mangrovi TaxID=3098077 RepID=A0ABU5J0J6_9BACI|nr:LysR family transcriptional regulator [Bacillus sp. 31A1R]MDZ5472891.1 LysR family transcriptional regulator [Bacillus sp. 31A1R]